MSRRRRAMEDIRDNDNQGLEFMNGWLSTWRAS
jgi:hypothetical protein